MDINGMFGPKSVLDELLNKTQDGQLNGITGKGNASTLVDSLSQGDTVEFSPSALARSQNMMSQNFVGGNARDTKYMDAQLAGAASVQSMQNAMSASLMSSLGAGSAPIVSDMSAAGEGLDTSSLDEQIAEGMFWGSNALLRAAKLMKDTSEAHEEVLEEQKAAIETDASEAMESKPEETKRIEEETSIEAKAEEAMAPKDENGEPIEQVGKTDGAPVDSSETEPSKATSTKDSSPDSDAKKDKSKEKDVLDVQTLLSVG